MISQSNCFVSNSCYIPGGWIITSLLRQHFLCRQTACCLLKNDDFVVWFWKTIAAMKRRTEREEGARRKDWEKEGRKGGRRRGTRQGLTRSDWQPCFLQFGSLLPLCFCEGSRNTSSAIHFISIPTPASHLHSVSFISSFLFSTCHYISWMITQWQFHRLSTGLYTALPASKAAKLPTLCYKHADFSFIFFPPRNPSALHPQSHYSYQVSTSNLPPLSVLIKSRSWLRDPYETPHGSVAPPGTLVQIICLTSLRQQMNQLLDSYNDWLSSLRARYQRVAALLCTLHPKVKILSWIRNVKDVKRNIRSRGWRSLNLSALALQQCRHY